MSSHLRLFLFPTDNDHYYFARVPLCLGVKDITFFLSTGHRDRATIVRYHPTANNILKSASYDLSINIWDVNKEKAALSLVGHLETVSIEITVYSGTRE